MSALIIFVFLCIFSSCKIFSTHTLYMDKPQIAQIVFARFWPKQFQVYWNVPTMQCKSKSKALDFSDLQEKYGITQNKGDSFRGEHVSILYDPGVFPALLKNESSKRLIWRNGGLPQEGSLQMHLEKFETDVNQLIPDESFSGIGIIDFESWRPIFRQNFGNLIIYKNESFERERARHWFWPQSRVEAEATRRFERAGQLFMQSTLTLARRLRPRARWGYYAYPYCFNISPNNMRESCPGQVRGENDRINWLWDDSLVLFPSLYLSKNLTETQQIQLVNGRVVEASRVARSDTDILPYVWYKYRDGGFLTEEDLLNTISTLFRSDASGAMIWGSSSDVNTVAKCEEMFNFVHNILGPVVARYTKGWRPRKVEESEVVDDLEGVRQFETVIAV